MGFPINIDEIAALSVDQRLELVQAIWDTIADDAAGLEVPQSHIDELDRRLAAYEADPHAGSTWAEVKARLTRPPGASS